MTANFELIRGRSRDRLTTVALFACAVALAWHVPSQPAQAAELINDGATVTIDTTISHGMTFRVEDADEDLTGDLNGNDGDLNYDTGLVSSVSKITSELEGDFGDVGVFARVSGFYDTVNQDGDRERTELSDAAKNRVGANARILDLYVDAGFEAGDVLIDARIGNHVLNWGESTFIQNGVNVINPFDVSQLRLAGSELREALLPVPMASVSVAPTDNLSLEGFYQFTWAETDIDPVGSYFSVTDYVGVGGDRAFIPLPGTGIPPTDLGFDFDDLFRAEGLTDAINEDLAQVQTPTGERLVNDLEPNDRRFLTVMRSPDIDPDDGGQFGLAAHYLSESLNNTEFGFFFVNYHSRLPLVSARHGSQEAIMSAARVAGAIGNASSATADTLGGQRLADVTELVTASVTASVMAEIADGTLRPDQARSEITSRVTAEVTRRSTEIQQRTEAQVGAVAQAVAVDRYAKSTSYFIEYPERLSVFGASFNTEVGRTGWALQGEVSFRPDAPLQIDDVRLFELGLAPLNTLLRGCPVAPDPAACQTNVLTSSPFGQKLQGYIERDVTQIQATTTKAFGPTGLGNSGGIFIAEAAGMFVHNMPKSSVTPLEATGGGDPADSVSWGYRAAGRLDYANAIGPATVSPFAQFQHDVSGSSPAPAGPFAEGRTSLTIGVGIEYLQRWQGNLSYTRMAGRNNELRDRDFVSLNVKFSF